VGDIQVRNRGTIGGSLAHGDPNADLPAAVVALDAELVATGPGGERTLRAREFFRDFLTTALEPSEILTEVRVPALDGAGSAYVKFNRRAQDWAIVGCAAIVRGDEEVVAWTGVGSTPVLAEGDWRAAADTLQPVGDLSGSTEYKRHLAKVLAQRAVTQARGE
jgi:aerobic carbon-monoxide dehydrogenase medium subunit